MSTEEKDRSDFNKKTKAMMRFQTIQLSAMLLSTGSLIASVIAPIVLTVTRGNPLWLVMFLVWPVCIFLMGMVKHSGAPAWFPALALLVFFLATPVPGWYWFIALATILAYHLQQNELPVESMKLNQAFEESGE